ncbi:MAG: GldG family protein [Spirochaetaceae bacterium]|nr:GldG family protein [Spirochaetaceae bacterium]
MKTTPKGRKVLWLLFTLFFILVILVSNRYYCRIDLTEGRRFTVSEGTRLLLQDLREPLRLTYYVSPQLAKLYPQTRDIKDFLLAYSSENPLISVVQVDPVESGLEQILASLGVMGRQIQTTGKSSTEFTTVYSAVILEYLGRSLVIPFILSADSLEYELTSRVLSLVQQEIRQIMVMVANGMTLEEDYSYVVPWLEASGFSCSWVSPQEFLLLQSEFSSAERKIPLLVLGSSALTQEEVLGIQNFAECGGNVLLFTSTGKADIYGDWTVVPSYGDYFTPVLEKWGVWPNNDLLCDISCFPITLYSDEDVPQYQTMNYPLWVASLSRYCSENPITRCLEGMHFFWANSLTVNNSAAEVLVYSSPSAWIMAPDYNFQPPFITNPFMVYSTAEQGGYVSGQYPIVALVPLEHGGGRVIVVADQYFVSTMMLDYTASSSNLDFVVNSLLYLSDESLLLEIKNRSYVSTALNKVSPEILVDKKVVVLIIICILMPLLVSFIIGLIFFIKNLKKRKDKCLKRN